MKEHDPSLRQSVDRLSATTRAPDGSLQRTLSVDVVAKLAAQSRISGSTVEIEALAQGILPLRYQRNHHALNPEDQIRLLRSRVVVVGLGGLGGTVTEILARVGVGHLVLVDADVFEDHNLNRQLLCTLDQLGQPKASAAEQRVRAVNPSIQVEAWQVHCDETNRMDLFRESHVVVDCLDNIPARFVLQDGARHIGVPLVSAAVAGLAGHVTTIFPQDPGLELIFGPRSADRTSPKGVETFLGCLPQAVSLIASIESAEVIKVLLGHTDRLLRNQLLVIDLDQNTYEKLRLT